MNDLTYQAISNDLVPVLGHVILDIGHVASKYHLNTNEMIGVCADILSDFSTHCDIEDVVEELVKE